MKEMWNVRTRFRSMIRPRMRKYDERSMGYEGEKMTGTDRGWGKNVYGYGTDEVREKGQR